ncbi:hypothetical protein HMPREF7215_0507 [Pyramidobacter piscolens W5455]|uniref:Uncharacterized protein n=1 Tax=Pyramidobacter piscolens W5455 TaxID=352165 RepID=A0ABP2HRK3_9BACT|nr:hypothetical protein HMPREF7215_0507 [Pyramidobacter piscolens W5455]
MHYPSRRVGAGKNEARGELCRVGGGRALLRNSAHFVFIFLMIL